MAFLDRVLEPPVYGWTKDGKLYVPTKSEIFSGFLGRLNFIKNKKNWIVATSWGVTLLLAVVGFIGMAFYLNWPLFALCFIYAAVILGTHGTVYLHRYGTHRAFKIKNKFWLFVIKNLTIKVLPEEIYIVSHLVHHGLCEKPGDPYNALAGGMYCYFSDANHHPINRTLTEDDYVKLKKAVSHTGIYVNSYEQYQKWGSLSHPFYTFLDYAINWSIWWGIFYLIGGPALAFCLFGATAFWAFGVRQFNYDGHGRGKDLKQEGSDFNSHDLSVNQLWPGYVSGEWHNNHHLYPQSARSGFLPHQLDLAWITIRFFQLIGGVSGVNDQKEHFYKHVYHPYIDKKHARESDLNLQKTT